MEYYADFGIDGGVSNGFGMKSPDCSRREEVILANNDKDALVEAAKKALSFSRNYLSNPGTDNTSVTILALYDSERRLLDQKDILRKEDFDGIQRFNWDEKGRLFIKCSTLEHMILAGIVK